MYEKENLGLWQLCSGPDEPRAAPAYSGRNGAVLAVSDGAGRQGVQPGRGGAQGGRRCDDGHKNRLRRVWRSGAQHDAIPWHGYRPSVGFGYGGHRGGAGVCGRKHLAEHDRHHAGRLRHHHRGRPLRAGACFGAVLLSADADGGEFGGQLALASPGQAARGDDDLEHRPRPAAAG